MDRTAPTTAQRKLLLHHRLYPGDAAFNIQIAYRIDGDVDLGLLRAALQQVADASVALNTTFDLDATGDVAVHHPGGARVCLLPAPWAESAGDEAQAVADWAGQRADIPMPPGQWPLYHITLLSGRFAAYLVIVCSHLVCDAYTMFNLGRMVSRLYAEPLCAAELATALADDPASLVTRRPAGDAIAAFRSWLSGVRRMTHPALREPRRDDGALPGRHVQRWLSDDLVAALAASPLAARSPYPVFLAAHAIVLSALTGQSDVVIGVPLAGRHGRRQRAALGYFVNTLPLALDLKAFGSFADLGGEISARLAAMLRVQDFDLSEHTGEVFGRHVPSPVMVDNSATYYHDRDPLRLPGCVVEPLAVPRKLIRYPIGLHVQAAGDRYLIGMEYLDRLAAADPIDCLEHVIRTGLSNPGIAPLGMGAVSPRAGRMIDRTLNARAAFEVPESLDAWFARTARQYADRVAVTDEAGEWTYAELDAAVSRAAAAIHAAGAGRYVAVAMRPRRELVAVLLGILRAGAAYVPLDPRASAERVRHILAQFDDPVLVADPDLLAQAQVAIRIDPARFDAGRPVASMAGPDDPAYVIFTSGSTGVPKGVEVSHRNVMRLMLSTDRHFDFGPHDVWSLFHSYAFDFSVWELFGCLLHGGRLVVPDEYSVRLPEDFLRLLCEEGVTVLNQTPSAFRRLTGVLTREAAQKLAVRWVVFGGEALYFDALRPWVDAVGERARLVNMYGITETTVHTTFYEVDPALVGTERASVVGRPLADLALAVVDDRLNRCPVGVVGELLVAGDGVAGGYFGQPELTAKKFLRGTQFGEVAYRSGDLVYLRPDGNLVYADRADRQVQLRGYRIELGEIENALRAVQGVSAAHVRMHKPHAAEPYLVAWIVAAGGLPDRYVRAALRERLPHYMIPAMLLRVADLALNVNGKVDEAKLPAPPEVHLTDTTDEEVLAAIERIWAETIHSGQIGPDDNFFEVGGTSMHLSQVYQRLVEELSVSDFTMVELFEYPTPAKLAARLGQGRPGQPAGGPRQRRHIQSRSTARRRACAYTQEVSGDGQ